MVVKGLVGVPVLLRDCTPVRSSDRRVRVPLEGANRAIGIGVVARMERDGETSRASCCTPRCIR